MRVQRHTLRRSLGISQLQTAASRDWWVVLLAITGSIQVAVSLRALLQPFPPPLDVDAALFQHAGWYISQGAVPYIHIWDPSPPLGFFTAVILSALSAGNVLSLHIISVVLTGIAAVGISVLVALMIVFLTGARLAGLLGGLMLYTFAQFYLHAARGFGFKHLALFSGFLALWFALRKRPAASGVFGVVSTFIWLPGAIFILLAFGISLRDRSSSRIMRYVSGIALTTVLVLLPIIYWDAVQPMITSMAAGFMVSEEQSLLLRLKKAAHFLNVSSVFLLPAAIAFVHVLQKRRRELWWVLVGATFFGVQILFLDFDNFPDLFPLMAFVSLLAGLFIAGTGPRTARFLAIVVLGCLLLAPVVHAGLNRGEEQPAISEPRIVRGKKVPSMQALYWQKLKPESCHYRFSPPERGWLRLMESRGVDTSCAGLTTARE